MSNSTGKSNTGGSSSEARKPKFWLYAFRDHLANLQAYTSCIDTADVAGDGDYKLLVADGSKKLKMFGGTSLQKELKLLGVPSAITSFYMEISDAFTRPVVAVSVGSYVFMYRNNNPLYRFTLPCVEIDEGEQTTWGALSRGEMSADAGTEQLDALLRSGIEVSTRTLEYLLLENPQEKEKFIERVRAKPLRQMDAVTCLSSINQDSPEDGGLSCLVIGCENRLVYILKNSAADVAVKVRMPSVPVHIVTAGCLKVEYRLIVSCRDSRIYSIKNGTLHTSVIQPDAQPSAIARFNNIIAVTTMANTLSYYTLKGKRQSNVFLPTVATNLVAISDPVTGEARAVVVALTNGEVRVYVGKVLQHVSQAYGTVTAMRYGRYGREDSALILVLQNGSLVVELLHRNANLNGEGPTEGGPPAEQGDPIPVPLLSSVFTAQTEREREYAVDMYRIFQYDLCRLGLLTARSYLRLLDDGNGTSSPTGARQVSPVSFSALTAIPSGGSPSDAPAVGDSTAAPGASSSLTRVPAPAVTIEAQQHQTRMARAGSLPSVSHSATHKMRVMATVQGLGPVFKIKVMLQNLGSEPLHNLVLLFLYAADTYTMQRSVLQIPYTVPGLTYPFEALVQLVEGETKGDGVLVVVTDSTHEQPFAVTLVDIPEAELLENL